MQKWLVLPLAVVMYGVYALPRALIAARRARRRLHEGRPRFVSLLPP